MKEEDSEAERFVEDKRRDALNVAAAEFTRTVQLRNHHHTRDGSFHVIWRSLSSKD
jgi:hypothetical protein